MDTRLAQDLKSLDAASSALETLTRRTSSKVCGYRSGREVLFSLRTFGGGWQVTASTARSRFSLDVFDRTVYPQSEQSLSLGDADFEQEYSVEGAPGPAIVRLLDEETRALILRLRPPRIRGRKGSIRVDKRYSYYWAEPTQIAQAIELAASLASRLEPELAADERAMLRDAPMAGSPYREALDASAIAAQSEDREKRVTALARRQDRRVSRAKKRWAVAGMIYLVLMGGLLLLDLLF